MVARLAIEGFAVGHWTDRAGHTGCTVVLCPAGATASADIRGGAPGTRETDLLQPGRTVERVHAVLLAGGSAFGLAAADGVMRWLEERGFGFVTPAAHVPIVPAAVLYDLAVGNPLSRPTAESGYAACENAGAEVEEGPVGAGTGARVGKMKGLAHASSGGIGFADLKLPDGVTVAALVAVNAVGHVIDPRSGAIIAGPRAEDGSFLDSVGLILQTERVAFASPGTNTTIGVIMTDARLDKAACARVATQAHNGLAHVIRPVHTQIDGDALFVLSLPQSEAPAADATRIGVAAAEVVAQAVVRAVQPGR